MTMTWLDAVAEIQRVSGCTRLRAEEIARANGFMPPDEASEQLKFQRRADVREKEEQAYVARLFREFGFTVRSLSQPRATKQSPGLPDLWCMHRELPIAFWWETKRQVGGRFSAEQIRFRDDCARCGVGYGAGDRHAARSRLIHLGLARFENGALEPIRRNAVDAAS